MVEALRGRRRSPLSAEQWRVRDKDRCDAPGGLAGLTVLPGGLLTDQELRTTEGAIKAAAALRSSWSREQLTAWRNSLSAAQEERDALPHSTREFAIRYRRPKWSVDSPWFHDIWYDAYDDDTKKRLFVMGPRFHAKTSTLLTKVLRWICENRHIRIGILSQTDTLAMYFLAEVKHELESNEQLVKDYFGGQSPRGDRWTSHNIVIAGARDGPQGISGKDVTLFSVSRGAQITGYHCDILIVDDLESKESTDSDTMREGTREWWAREVVPVVVPGGRILATGTRKHFDDLYSYWLKPGSGWTVLDVVKSVYDEHGMPVWPEMWDEVSLRAKKAEMDAQDLLAWPQEFLNQPRPSETQMFYPDRWPKIRIGDIPKGLTLIQIWDLAISEKTTADYTVGWTIGIDEASNIYLLEQRRGHWDFNRTLSEIAEMGKEWTARPGAGELVAIGIEQVAYQAAAVQEAARRTMLPIVPVEYKGKDKSDKVQRARLLEARAAAGKVFHPVYVDDDNHEHDPEWWLPFAAEALYFPAGAHDDQVDSLANGVKLAGWQADSIQWAYGIWTCVNPVCRHQFVWEANRPCPKCGTKAPAVYENPEMMALGAFGSIRSSGGEGA